jgi:hypothetical protein
MRYECLSEAKIKAALLMEARFVSQQVIYHRTGDDNITSHFDRQRAGEVGLRKSIECLQQGTTEDVRRLRSLD